MTHGSVNFYSQISIFAAAVLMHPKIMKTQMPAVSGNGLFRPLLTASLFLLVLLRYKQAYLLHPEDFSRVPTSLRFGKIKTTPLALGNRGQNIAIAILGYLSFFSLTQTYEAQLNPILSPIQPVYSALKPTTILRLFHVFLPAQYWRLHSFAPRYDFSFRFAGTASNGSTLDLSEAIQHGLTHWYTLTTPNRTIDWNPNSHSRLYHRLVYNFLWYLKKSGSQYERDQFGRWLKFTYERKFPGLILNEIQWRTILHVTPDPGAPELAPIYETFQRWTYTSGGTGKS